MSLEAFVRDARHRIQSGWYDHGPDLRPNGSLADALQPGTVIAELKPVSPSEGPLLQGPPDEVLADYVAGGAAALSILSDPDHFGGSLELLAKAHATGLPILMKDFIIDVRQIDAAARHGCSAVLLIERILAPSQREMLVLQAHDRGMEVLLEIHDDTEWQQARQSEADLIGVNARDLDTLDVDAASQLRLIEKVAKSRPVVALSGIRNRQDCRVAQEAGATGVLVGTALMRHPQRSLALRGLQRPLVKVCGLTHPEDVLLAAQAGADLAGIVVMASSPRSVTLKEAANLAALARELGLRPVLVTPEPDAAAVAEAVRQVRPDLVQWHASQPIDLGIGVLHAVGPEEPVPDGGHGILLDSSTSGSGTTHDWQRSRDVCQADPSRLSFIAGGLAGDNVAQALAATGAWGADASSRLESSPGRKDPEAVRDFVRQARAPQRP